MLCLIQQSAFAGSAAEIDKEVGLALEKLYASSPIAQKLSNVVKGILIFPDVIIRTGALLFVVCGKQIDGWDVVNDT